MISAGIDVGRRVLKVAILSGSKLIGDSTVLTGAVSPGEVYEAALAEAVRRAGISRGEIESIVATGAGAEALPFKQRRDVFCLASAVHLIMPEVHVVVDIGAMRALAVRCQEGKPLETANNSKCASGVGMYLELVSDILMVKLEDMGELSLRWKKDIEISSICAVFAESEIISLVHQGNSLEDIVHGVVRALARQTYPLLLKVDGDGDIALTGGVARNKGVATFLREMTNRSVLVPERPELVPAMGAALIAAE